MNPWTEPIKDASAWTGKDLTSDRSWEFEITPEHKDELDAALQSVKALQVAEITKDNFRLPNLGKMLSELLHELKEGKGFALLKGVPTDGYEMDDLEKLYWGVCAYVGTGKTQNSEAGLVHYVTDGKLRPEQGTRGVGNPGPVGLHVDLTDCVALYCVQQAPDDPHSLVASSMMVYNEILRHHPEWLPRLYEGFIWSRKAEEAPSESPVSDYRVPVFSEANGVVSCRFNSHWIQAGLELAGESLTEEEAEMFEFIREMSFKHCFDFPLHRGDIAFCNNYTVFHGRAGHEPVADEAQKRVLLRAWLDLDDIRPFADEGRVRYGVVRHGKLGWSAEDLLAGNHHTPHRRREDGVPVVGQ